MKYILKLAFPLIVIIILAGLVISSMSNPNPVVVLATVTLVTIVLLVQLRKIRKKSKKHYRNFTKSTNSASTKASKSTNTGLTPQQVQAAQNELRGIAQRFSTREQLTAHADMQISVTSNGDGTFSINYNIIRDGHEESYSAQVDSAAQVVLNDLEWKLSDAVKNLKI